MPLKKSIMLLSHMNVNINAKLFFFKPFFCFTFQSPKGKRHYSQNVNRKPKPNKNTVVSYNNVVIKIRVGYPPNQGNG